MPQIYVLVLPACTNQVVSPSPALPIKLGCCHEPGPVIKHKYSPVLCVSLLPKCLSLYQLQNDFSSLFFTQGVVLKLSSYSLEAAVLKHSKSIQNVFKEH